jgi:hypothetical protein
MLGKNLRGQFSGEFLIVVGCLIMILGSVSIPLYNRSCNDAQRLTDISEAREAATILANALNTIYADGVGSRQTVEYWLPKGVVAFRACGYENVDVDGIDTNDTDVPANGRADVQVLFDFDGDGMWDNTRESVVIVDTILPSKWDENGNERGGGWVRENCVHVEDKNFNLNPNRRTRHRVTLEYVGGAGSSYSRRIAISDVVVESV